MRALAVLATLAACTTEPTAAPPPSPAPGVAVKAVPPAPPPAPRPPDPPPYERHRVLVSSDGMGAPDPSDDRRMIMGGRLVYDRELGTIYTVTIETSATRRSFEELTHESARVLTAAERDALEPLVAAALVEPPHAHAPIPDVREGMIIWDGAGRGHEIGGGDFPPAAGKLATAMRELAQVKAPRRTPGMPRAKLPDAILAVAPMRGIYDIAHHVIYDRDARTVTGGLMSDRVDDAGRGQLAGAVAAGWDAPAGDGLVLLDGDQVRVLDANSAVATRIIEVLRYSAR